MSEPTQQHRDEAHALLDGPLWSAYWARCVGGLIHESRCDAIARALARRDATTLSEGRAAGLREAADRIRRYATRPIEFIAQLLEASALASPQVGTADRYHEGLRRALTLAEEVREQWNLPGPSDFQNGAYCGCDRTVAAIRAELPADAPPKGEQR